MSAVFGSLIKGLPALAGVLWGITLFTPSSRAMLWPLLALGLAVLMRAVGVRLLGKLPRVGLFLLELWIVAIVALMALATQGIVWLSLAGRTWFPPEQEQALSGALVGAVTTYLAMLWTEDLGKGTGPLWPATQFKEGLRAAFAAHPHVPPRESEAHRAIYAPRVSEGPDGWDWHARWERAKIISDHLKQQS